MREELMRKSWQSEAGSNRRAFFKYVNSKLKVRPDVSTLIGENGELVHDEKEMANIYNRYFHASFNRPVDLSLIHI